MRITSSMYYKNLYSTENSKLSKEMFDVNRQIASGLKIDYAKDDVTTFTETMRLDNEITTLDQVQKSTDNGYKISDQTDSVMNEFSDLMNRMRTLLVQASNDTNDETSRNAIAKEMRGIEDNLKGLANTSINGRYLFSGSAVNVKPINEDGTYNGNDVAMQAMVGNNNQQQFNITGARLFLGEELSVKRTITSNVVNTNAISNDSPTTATKISDFMGDTAGTNTAYFYLRGTKHNGEAFDKKIALSPSNASTMQNLLDEIGKAYGNTASATVVNVTLNDKGEITVEDRLRGSSKLDFHMVGALDPNGGTAADVTQIDDLDDDSTTYPPPAGKAYVKEFVQSNLTSATGAATTITSLVYDRTQFNVNGSSVTANAMQVVKGTNAFATPSTKLSEVADLSQGTAGTLDGTKFSLTGKTVSGAAYDFTINLDTAGSTFTDNNTGNSYNIYDVDPNGRKAVPADEMTYQQLMDVMGMVVTNNLPASSPGTAAEYDTAVQQSHNVGETTLTYDGKLKFQDFTPQNTKATIAIHDVNSGDFSKDPAVMTFNTNNALTINDPKTDFFKDIDDMIRAVENYSNTPDSKIPGDPRNIGMQAAISRMDELQDHFLRSHSEVGAQSNTLQKASERVSVLKITTETLRSSVIDTDLAEASLRLSQLTNNFQAMLSTVGRVSKLSLVNYL